MVRTFRELHNSAERILRSDWQPSPEFFGRQCLVFATLNLGLIGLYLAIKAILAFQSGRSSPAVFAVLLAGFAIQGAELLWLASSKSRPSGAILVGLAWSSILLNALIVVLLTLLTPHRDNEYHVLMVVPLLQAAFTFRLVPTLVVITLADFLTFFAVYSLHSVDEYFESGGASLIYSVVGVIVWLLVTNLRERETQLKRNFDELEQAREQLLAEEKLALAGRLSSAIAHEIRNPVAMIASALATASRLDQEDEREKMFEIAASEAARLERLTGDFLAYARPQAPQIAPMNVGDTLNYVASIARVHPVSKGAEIEVDSAEDLEAEFDSSQLQQALLNLVLNALEDNPAGGAVTLRGRPNGNGGVKLEVISRSGPIPAETIARIFEPFFTTKPKGTGLGLAIARNIARAHQGDLVLSSNEPECVCFTIEIPLRNGHAHACNGKVRSDEYNIGRR